MNRKPKPTYITTKLHISGHTNTNTGGKIRHTSLDVGRP